MRQRHVMILTGQPEAVSRVAGLLRELAAFFSGNDLTVFISAPLEASIQGELFTGPLHLPMPTTITPLLGGEERER